MRTKQNTVPSSNSVLFSIVHGQIYQTQNSKRIWPVQTALRTYVRLSRISHSWSKRQTTPRMRMQTTQHKMAHSTLTDATCSLRWHAYCAPLTLGLLPLNLSVHLIGWLDISFNCLKACSCSRKQTATRHTFHIWK